MPKDDAETLMHPCAKSRANQSPCAYAIGKFPPVPRHRLDRHASREYLVIGLTERIAHDAEDILAAHPLRAYDAVQLASAVNARGRFAATGFGPLLFVSADQRLLTAPVSIGQALTPGAYPITMRNVAAAPQADLHGVPYALTFGDSLLLTGAYWHNRFGAASSGAAIQVTPPLAQWLYPRAAKIIIS